jgi:hypothetical protein
MASPINALVCALIATAFWPLLGYALGSRLVPRILAIGAAPVIGFPKSSDGAVWLADATQIEPAAICSKPPPAQYRQWPGEEWAKAASGGAGPANRRSRHIEARR